MKKVYYKGLPYDFNVRDDKGERVFALYQDGTVIHEVAQSDLDIKSTVSLILEEYYNELWIKTATPVGN